MSFNKLKLTLLLSLLMQSFAFAISDYSDFLVVPTAEILGDKAFQIRGTIGYHHYVCEKRGEPSMCDWHPFVSSLSFGLFNSLEIGVQFGSNISLDVKNRIVRSNGYIPAVALGARAFVQSPEAYFYSASGDERKGQTGEFYTAVEWGNELWKILGGVSAFPNMEANSVAPFWGFEQGLGTKKISILYEGFFRYGFSHHNAGLSIKPLSSLQISLGASEFYRFFFTEDGDFKFRIKNPNARNGYRAPGVYASLAINGGFGSGIQNQKNQFDSLKRDFATQSAVLADLRQRLDTLEKLYYEDESSPGSYVQKLQKDFMEIVNDYKSDEFNLDSLHLKEQNFMDKGPDANKFIINAATSKTLETETRIVAIRVMSHFPDSAFLETLGSIVADNSNEQTAREAALALGTINTTESRKVLSTVVNQTSGTIREIIIEIIGAL